MGTVRTRIPWKIQGTRLLYGDAHIVDVPDSWLEGPDNEVFVRLYGLKQFSSDGASALKGEKRIALMKVRAKALIEGSWKMVFSSEGEFHYKDPNKKVTRRDRTAEVNAVLTDGSLTPEQKFVKIAEISGADLETAKIEAVSGPKTILRKAAE